MKILKMSSGGIDVGSPLYLYPSDGSSTVVVEKLQGNENYRPWKRSMELALPSNSKLGFVTGSVEKDKTDPVKKYQVNKQIYKTKQNGKSVNEYYTEMQVLWEELEDLTNYPPPTDMNAKMAAYPIAGEACNAIQQEESQRSIFKEVKEESEGIAIYSKTGPPQCTHCGKKGHTWTNYYDLVGYPSGFDKNKEARNKEKEVENSGSKEKENDSGGARGRRGGRGYRGRGGRYGRGGRKMATNVQTGNEGSKVGKGEVKALGVAEREVYVLMEGDALDDRRRKSRGVMEANTVEEINIPDVVKSKLNISKAMLWHQRLGHAPIKGITKL
ncbi:hypothetical protein RDABS01_020582 [Bienertia sinuspersici]